LRIKGGAKGWVDNSEKNFVGEGKSHWEQPWGMVYKRIRHTDRATRKQKKRRVARGTNGSTPKKIAEREARVKWGDISDDNGKKKGGVHKVAE